MQPFFADHVALLGHFLTRRREIVERIERTLLNVQGKDLSRSRDRRQFERLLSACFFDASGMPPAAAALNGQLAAAHLADGFEPVLLDRYAHELDPLELIPRAYLYWDRTRWPGASGRSAYARTIFSACIIRQLELLTLRIWDDGVGLADSRLDDVQVLLDWLNSPADAVHFVDDARWLIQTAQGPLTKHLQPYFDISDRLRGSFLPFRRLEAHAAGAKLAGGHLRSQLRYRVWNTGKPLHDPEILAFTRLSNSMDTALLVRDLVPLLEQYRADRGWVVDAILQGLSAEPDLLLTRWDLLEPCTAIEDVNQGDHQALLARYRELVADTVGDLIEDAARLDPARHAYSPFGISYGFCADLFNNVAAATLTGARPALRGIEEMFAGDDEHGDAARLACADAWRRLPTRGGEREHFDHSPEWAGLVFGSLMHALSARAARAGDFNASNTPAGRLFVNSAPEGTASAQEHCFTTDVTLAMTTGAMPCAAAHFLNDRAEGRFLASAETDGQWFGVSKLIVTLFIGEGKDALITNVPSAVAAKLRAPSYVGRIAPLT